MDAALSCRIKSSELQKISWNKEKQNIGSFVSIGADSIHSQKSNNYENDKNTGHNLSLGDGNHTVKHNSLDIHRYKNQNVHVHPKPKLCLGMIDSDITLALSKLVLLSEIGRQYPQICRRSFGRFRKVCYNKCSAKRFFVWVVRKWRNGTHTWFQDITPPRCSEWLELPS